MLSDQQKELENKPFLRENDTFEWSRISCQKRNFMSKFSLEPQFKIKRSPCSKF